MAMTAENMSSSVSITLPDGSVRTMTTGTTGRDLAYDIATSLGKAALAVKVNDEMWDLSRELPPQASVEIITRKSPEALELIRHDAAHVMAEAVQRLYPETKVSIGPAIEDGFYYDFYRESPFTPDDLGKIEAEMSKIITAKKPFTRQVWNRDDAIAHFEKLGETFKVELIQDLPADETITIYTQGDGDNAWGDLCRGPHMQTTGDVGTAFKLMTVAGSYWRGDSDREQMQRIYGTAWRDQKELDAHITRLEEAEKRDHRKLGKQLDLFHFQEEAPGQVFWHHNGYFVYRTLLAYMREKLVKYGYEEIETPQMLDQRFWRASGHWDKYHENMFVVKDDRYEHAVALKPMSCPGGAQVYKNSLKSYRDLPLKLAEFGKVFRREASGARHGLMRVQAFTQDDAHIFCTDDQIEDEVVKMCDLIKEVYTDLGLADGLTIYFSTRPDERIGSDEDWDRAEDALRKVLDRLDLPWVLNEGDGAFYAPKLDFMVKDAIGRQWQCGTVQVDMNMPTRLDLSYVGADGETHKPHMIHRAIMGSIERFLGILIEHFAGAFPLWLAPKQIVVASIVSDFDDYANSVAEKLRAAGLRVETDLRVEKISYKIREHSVQKVPYILAVGEREQEASTVAVRTFGSDGQKVEALDSFIARLTEEVATLALPAHMAATSS